MRGAHPTNLFVIPAKAGIQSFEQLDPGLRRGEGLVVVFGASPLVDAESCSVGKPKQRTPAGFFGHPDGGAQV